MTAVAPGAAPGGKGVARLRRGAPVLALVAALLAGAAVLQRDPPSRPLDPRSTAGDGTAALLEVLHELGAEVTVGVPPGRAGADAAPSTVLVLGDVPDDTDGDVLRELARAGATVVVTDPGSPVAPEVAGGTDIAVVAATLPRGCDLEALRGAERVLAPASVVFEVPDGATGCYGRGAGRWLVARPLGRGTLVVLGGPGFLVNARLASADNAVLAAALLAPQPGTRVTVVPPAAGIVGGGDRTLADLVPPRVRLAVAQLALAFLVFVAWRARRLGRPVVEPAEVRLAGSELVVAVGNLLHSAGASDHAAGLLRDDLRATLCRHLDLPQGADDEMVAAAASRRGADRDEVLAALQAGPVASPAALVAVAQRTEAVRDAVLDGPQHARHAETGAVRA